MNRRLAGAIALGIVAGIGVGAGAAAQLTIRPGQYEFTVDMKIAGAPADVPKAVFDAAGFRQQKKLECLTPEDVKGDLAQLLTRAVSEEDCKLTDLKTTGNRIVFTATCQDDDVRMVLRSEMTVSGDSFSGTTTATDQDGGVTTMKILANRTGECAK
jgi:hypothetical protein